MADESKRSRLRMDISHELVCAARARAGFDGVDVNVVIARALENYLTEELEMLRKKQQAAGKKEAAPPSRKK